MAPITAMVMKPPTCRVDWPKMTVSGVVSRAITCRHGIKQQQHTVTRELNLDYSVSVWCSGSNSVAEDSGKTKTKHRTEQLGMLMTRGSTAVACLQAGTT